MKIRVTIMTENNQHVPISKEKIEQVAAESWGNFLKLITENSSDNAYLECCEVVEE